METFYLIPKTKITIFTLCVKKSAQTLEYIFLCSLRERIFVAIKHSWSVKYMYVICKKMYSLYFQKLYQSIY